MAFHGSAKKLTSSVERLRRKHSPLHASPARQDYKRPDVLYRPANQSPSNRSYQEVRLAQIGCESPKTALDTFSRLVQNVYLPPTTAYCDPAYAVWSN